MKYSVTSVNPHLALLKEQLEPLRKVEPSKLQECTLPLVRTWLDLQRAAIKLDFMEAGPHRGNAARMLTSYSQAMDALLSALYALISPENSGNLCIAAVGGYGRGELFPYSDVDLLFIYDQQHAPEAARITLLLPWESLRRLAAMVDGPFLP